MPTPVGHALAGFAAGWMIAQFPPPPMRIPPPPPGSIRDQVRNDWRQAVAFAALGALPDIDLLFHAHSTYTHSIGAALFVWFVASTVYEVPFRVAAGSGAAVASHVLLDFLGVDTSPPYGITALWPFEPWYCYSGLDIFPAADRRYWLPSFWPNLITAIKWELIILVPVALLVIWIRRPRSPFVFYA